MRTTIPDRWLGVEPRHLVTFAAVADAGSFRGAAASMGYVQSAVSQQIAHLERTLDTRLIERGRGNRELVLTVAGRTLLVHARRIVDQMRAACADVAYLSNAEPLRVAIEPAATSLLTGLPRSGHPSDGGLSVCEVPAIRHQELVSAGAVDIAVGTFPRLRQGLAQRTFAIDRWVLVLPEHWRGNGRAHDELPGGSLIEDRSHPLPEGAPRLGAERVVGCDRLSVAIDLVRAGVGGAVLPRLGVQVSEPGIRLVDLGERLPPRPVSMIWLAARRLPGALPRLGSFGPDTEAELVADALRGAA